jgi:hypothetical protein
MNDGELEAEAEEQISGYKRLMNASLVLKENAIYQEN